MTDNERDALIAAVLEAIATPDATRDGADIRNEGRAALARLVAALSAATTERDEAWDTLWRIANNAEAWHGPPEPETGQVRALRVIGEWARAALAAAAPATTLTEPEGEA